MGRRDGPHAHLIRKTQESDLKRALRRDPHEVKTWWRYLQLLRQDEEEGEQEARTTADTHAAQTSLLRARSQALSRRVPVYECALKHLPGSYKLWFAYLSDLAGHARACARHSGSSRKSQAYFAPVNAAYERALQFMHKFPRIWRDYCELLMHQCLFTRTRQTFDRALQALPVTQHEPVWEAYTKFLRGVGVPVSEGGVGGTIRLPAYAVASAYDRYCQFDSTRREELVTFLLEAGHHDEAARQLVVLLTIPVQRMM